MTQEEQHLVSRIRNHDVAAYEALFNHYYIPLTVFANSWLDAPQDARDLVQDLFVKLWEQRAEFTVQVSLKAYLYRSVRNAALNYKRKEQTREGHHQTFAETTDQVDFRDRIEEAEQTVLIHEAIRSLPEQCGKIFRMSRFQGIRNAEIAERLKLSKRTIETQISKALRVLRSQLKK